MDVYSASRIDEPLYPAGIRFAAFYGSSWYQYVPGGVQLCDADAICQTDCGNVHVDYSAAQQPVYTGDMSCWRSYANDAYLSFAARRSSYRIGFFTERPSTAHVAHSVNATIAFFRLLRVLLPASTDISVASSASDVNFAVHIVHHGDVPRSPGPQWDPYNTATGTRGQYIGHPSGAMLCMVAEQTSARTLVHEMSHALGLEHLPFMGSIMQPPDGLGAVPPPLRMHLADAAWISYLHSSTVTSSRDCNDYGACTIATEDSFRPGESFAPWQPMIDALNAQLDASDA